jgi:hypothetical protein
MSESPVAQPKLARHVPLPVIDEATLRRTQSGGAVWGDSRRFPRFCASAECMSVSEGTYAPAGPISYSQTVLLRDLSRGGLRFLHGAQLFPGERCEITLPNGVKKRLEAIWCRRVSAGLYMSGCRFLSVDKQEIDETEDEEAGDEAASE